MSRWYERNEVTRITPAYIRAYCKITEREERLLEIVNERKLVRRDMLEVISPDFRYLGSSRTRTLNRSINKLFKNMCLDKIHEPQTLMRGNTPAIVSLDRAGSYILDVPHKPRIKQTRDEVDGKDYVFRTLPANYYHVNGINQLEVETILFCEENGAEIVQWVLEKGIELFYGQNRVSLIPDILLHLKLSDTPLNDFKAYIEFDTGSESERHKNPPIIKNKVLNYRKYKVSKLWENEFSTFPFILFVTEIESRAKFFTQTCESNGLHGVGIYYKNYKTFLERLVKKH